VRRDQPENFPAGRPSNVVPAPGPTDVGLKSGRRDVDAFVVT
jgi:hypothetical protein